MSKISVGQTMPDFQVLTSIDGETSLHKLAKKTGKTILWVLRYIGCPTCRYDVHMLAQNYDRFTEKNAQVCVVMQSRIEFVREATKEENIPFEIICDEKQEIYQTLSIEATQTKEERLPKTEEGVIRLEEKRKRVKEEGFTHGVSEGNEQQLPALFIIDQNAKVLYVHYAADMIDMPSVDEAVSLI